MGIILSAMAAAGDEGVKSASERIKQMNLQDLENQRADLETQKNISIAKAMDNIKTDSANAMRQQLGARSVLSDADKQGIIERNANAAYHNPTRPDAEQASPANRVTYSDMLPEEIARFQPTQPQLDQATVRNLVASGDISPMDPIKLDQQEVANTIAMRRLDQMDQYNTGRLVNGAANADARMTSANAQATRAARPPAAGSGGRDPNMNSLQLLRAQLVDQGRAEALAEKSANAEMAITLPSKQAAVIERTKITTGALAVKRAALEAAIQDLGKKISGAAQAGVPSSPSQSSPGIPANADSGEWRKYE